MAAVNPAAAPPVLYIDDWQAWWDAITEQGVLVELLALALCGLLAWGITHALRRARAGAAPDAESVPATAGGQRRSVLLGERGLQGILFPLLWLLLASIARFVILHWQPAPVMRVALPVLVALVAIRGGVTVLRAVFPGLAIVRVLERTISWVAWVAMVLWVSGVLPLVLEFLDGITWKMGSTQVSVRTLIEGALTAGALMLLALWVSSLIEARLLRSASGAVLSVRKVIANAVRAFMVFVGLLLGLSAVGIDLTALSVLSGAVGVGIGLGLQKLAANYVSGFMVLAERSVRIGDPVRVGGFEGRITD
ncbi:mechanosensitive ion channel family protein, partial [Ottowia sp.]|uniref:mechanosensitive ion channel family protein n=1 Tax=Ottowia sp. TaxID=1898956 RepID=UPI0039E45428